MTTPAVLLIASGTTIVTTEAPMSVVTLMAVALAEVETTVVTVIIIASATVTVVITSIAQALDFVVRTTAAIGPVTTSSVPTRGIRTCVNPPGMRLAPRVTRVEQIPVLRTEVTSMVAVFPTSKPRLGYLSRTLTRSMMKVRLGYTSRMNTMSK